MIIVAVLALATAMPRATPDTVQLTLARAIAIADSGNSDVQLAVARTALTGVDVLRRYGAFLPAATASAGYAHQSGTTFLSQSTTIPTDASFSTVAYHLAVNYNIFNGLRDRAALQASLAGEEAASFDVIRAREQIAFDVTQAFLQVILDRSLVDITRQNFALSQTREAQLVELVRVGRRPPPDLYRQQAETASDTAAIVDAVNRERDDQLSLLRRLRLPLGGTYSLVAPSDTIAPAAFDTSSIDAVARVAASSRADVRSAEIATQVADANLRSARGERLPRLDLGIDLFGFGRVFEKQEQDGNHLLPAAQRELWSQLFPQSSYSVSLGVTWAVLDRGATRFDISRATIDEDVARLRYEDVQERAESEAREAAIDYSSATQRLAATAQAESASDTAFAAVQARYDTGLSTFVDVLSAQTFLTRARSSHAEAVIRLELARELLRLAAGGTMPP